MFVELITLIVVSFSLYRFKPWYLEECSSTLSTTYSSGTPGHDKSIASVDMDGRLRPDHICTVEHTGKIIRLIWFAAFTKMYWIHLT